jgi:hypothetical protein
VGGENWTATPVVCWSHDEVFPKLLIKMNDQNQKFNKTNTPLALAFLSTNAKMITSSNIKHKNVLLLPHEG